MDSRGGCCIARYAGGGAYDMSKVDRIMLKYRPIAPKPASGGSVSSEAGVRTGRGKRRYVRVNNNKRFNSIKKRKGSPDESADPHSKTSSGGSVSGGDEVVTLPLLPEIPERKDSPARGSSDDRLHLPLPTKKAKINNSPIWLSFNKQRVNDNHVPKGAGHVTAGSDQAVVTMPQPVKVVGSCVTVECVTDTWVDGDLGWADEEKMMNLERDTCPGFISDNRNRIWWTNKAYGEMAGQVAGEEMIVWLVMKKWVSLPVKYPAFTCKVRVTGGKERSSSMMLPCDVWRMESGGFAWRLDVKAALCLGVGN